jgi:cytosine/adenosine deaminase-related metal-dependent hydrolase
MAVMKDGGDFLPAGPAAHRPATEGEIAGIKRLIEEGLQQGAPAVGVGAAYTEAATYGEILGVFRLAARYGAPVHVHLRGASSAALKSADRIQGLSQAIAAAISGAPLHVVHVNSSGQEATARISRSSARRAGGGWT